MADLSDVESSLTAVVWNAIYPGGANTAPANGLATKVASGWPDPNDIDADVAASPSVVNISVFCQPGLERNTTRYPQDWQDQTRVAPTITAAVAGSNITLGGAVTVGNYASIVCNNLAFSYIAIPGDTLTTIAAALVALINVTGKLFAFNLGPVITIVGRSDIVARVAAPGTSIQELGRSNQRFIVTIWAANNAARVATARIVRPALEVVNFLTLADGTGGRLLYESSCDVDRAQKQNIMCRDLFFWVEYPTTQTMAAYPITISQEQINVADGTPGGTTFIQNG